MTNISLSREQEEELMNHIFIAKARAMLFQREYPSLDPHEIYSRAMQGLLNGVLNYNPLYKTKPSTFYTRKVDFSIMDYRREFFQRDQFNQLVQRNCSPTDENEEEEIDREDKNQIPPSVEIIEKEASSFVNRAIKTLSKRHQIALQVYFFNGERTVKKSFQKAGINPAQGNIMKKRALRALEKALYLCSGYNLEEYI